MPCYLHWDNFVNLYRNLMCFYWRNLIPSFKEAPLSRSPLPPTTWKTTASPEYASPIQNFCCKWGHDSFLTLWLSLHHSRRTCWEGLCESHWDPSCALAFPGGKVLRWEPGIRYSCFLFCFVLTAQKLFHSHFTCSYETLINIDGMRNKCYLPRLTNVW